MKKKLLVLVAMLLCVVTVLASCASSMKFEKVVGDGTYNDENPTLTTAAKVDVKGTYDASLSDGDLAVFVETDTATQLSTYTVYNLATGASVWTATETSTESGATTTRVTYTVSVTKQWDTTWFQVTTTTYTAVTEPADSSTSKTVKLYSAVGTEFATATDAYNFSARQVLDLIIFDEKAYRIADDGTIAHAFDFSALRTVPAVTKKVGDFYFEKLSGGFAILDAQLNTVVVYNTPHYMSLSDMYDGGDTSDAYCLANGNVLVQYVVMLDTMAEDYDFVMASMKFDLRSVLVNAESGKVKELDLDYMIMSNVDYKDNDDDAWLYGEKIENIATVCYPEDGQIDLNKANWKLVALGNDGKVDGVIDNLIPNMDNTGLKLVATNRWIVSNMAGQSFLLNEKGEILSEVTGISDKDNANYFILNNKIYDWDLNMKYDMTANKINAHIELAHGVLMMNEDKETLLYANGEVKTLIAKDVENKYAMPLPIGLDSDENKIYSTEGFVIITRADDDKLKYEFCNDLGTVVLTLENVVIGDVTPFVCAADSSNAFMIKCTTVPAEGETGKTEYYRFG